MGDCNQFEAGEGQTTMPVHVIPTSEVPQAAAMDLLKAAHEWMFQAVEEEDDLGLDLALEETDRAARRVKMTEPQKREYALYRKACRTVGVMANRADFLMGEIDSCVTREMDWKRPQRAMAASA